MKPSDQVMPLSRGDISTLYHAMSDLLPNLIEGEYKEYCKELTKRLWDQIVKTS